MPVNPGLYQVHGVWGKWAWDDPWVPESHGFPLGILVVHDTAAGSPEWPKCSEEVPFLTNYSRSKRRPGTSQPQAPLPVPPPPVYLTEETYAS